MTRSIDINPAAGVLRQARYFPEEPALIYEGEELDYASAGRQDRGVCTGPLPPAASAAGTGWATSG